LIASFFDEFNEIKISDISDIQDDQFIIIYPHEIEVDHSSPLKAQVTKNYFQGNYFLIEADFNGQSIFIKNNIELNGQIGIKISKKLLELRSKN
jgi:hypothetical protein